MVQFQFADGSQPSIGGTQPSTGGTQPPALVHTLAQSRRDPPSPVIAGKRQVAQYGGPQDEPVQVAQTVTGQQGLAPTVPQSLLNLLQASLAVPTASSNPATTSCWLKLPRRSSLVPTIQLLLSYHLPAMLQ